METADFRRLLATIGADAYVVSAQGEEQLLALLAREGSGPAAEDVSGVWVRRGDHVLRVSGRLERARSLDDDYVRWSALRSADLYHTVHMRTARSCAFKCAFCSYPANQGALTLSSPSTLRRELQERSTHDHVRSIVFTDDTFNVPLRRFRKLCGVLSEFDFRWYSFFRVQYCDRETVDRMVDSGCAGVFLGIESVDDTVLRNMDKQTTPRAYRRGMDHLSSANLLTHAGLIVGFPGDRPENVGKTADFLDDYGIDTFAVNPWYYSHGTPIHRRRREFGLSGNHCNWSHDTMDSRVAAELCLELAERPARCVYLDDANANGFWGALMLHANGFLRGEIHEMARAYSRALLPSTGLVLVAHRSPFPRPPVAPRERAISTPLSSRQPDSITSRDTAAPGALQVE